MDKTQLLALVKKLYLKDLYSIQDITNELKLSGNDIRFLFTQNNVTIRTKVEGQQARMYRLQKKHDTHKPTKGVLEQQVNKHGVTRAVKEYYRGKATIKDLNRWVDEYGIKVQRSPRFLTPERRIENILNRYNKQHGDN